MADITQDRQGTFHWTFDYNLWRDPTVFLTTFKVLAVSALAVVLFLGVIDLMDGGAFGLQAYMRLCILALGIALVFSLVGYCIYALTHGGSYRVHFTMDETGIEHRASSEVMKRSRAFSALNTLGGLATGSPTPAGIGLSTAAHDTLRTDFAQVRSIQGNRRRGVIKLNEPFSKMQVYVEPQDFDLVLGHIRERCPKAKIR